jgi:hypothetical protein
MRSKIDTKTNPIATPHGAGPKSAARRRRTKVSCGTLGMFLEPFRTKFGDVLTAIFLFARKC